MPTPLTGPGAFAVLADVQTVYEQKIPDDSVNRVQALLDYASARLRRRLPDLDADVASGAVDAQLARFALVSAVLRVLRNPNGMISETAGEFSYRLDTAVASGALTFTEDELGDLVPVSVGARVGRARSIRLSVPDWRLP